MFHETLVVMGNNLLLIHTSRWKKWINCQTLLVSFLTNNLLSPIMQILCWSDQYQKDCHSMDKAQPSVPAKEFYKTTTSLTSSMWPGALGFRNHPNMSKFGVTYCRLWLWEVSCFVKSPFKKTLECSTQEGHFGNFSRDSNSRTLSPQTTAAACSAALEYLEGSTIPMGNFE